VDTFPVRKLCFALLTIILYLPACSHAAYLFCLVAHSPTPWCEFTFQSSLVSFFLMLHQSLSLIALGLVVTTGASVVPLVKVLPLGDSITFGCGSDAAPPNWYACCTAESGGYRAPLWAALNGSSINASVLMVGTESNGPSWMPQEQRAHEGHPGWTISRIKGLESKWVALAPDVVLLMAGTNDIGQMHPAAQIQQDMKDLLATLRTTLPLARIYVTSLLTFYSSEDPGIPQEVETYNAALPALVAAVNGTFVDINKATGMCAPNNSTLDSLCSVCNGPCGGYNPAVVRWGALFSCVAYPSL
jgi:hypothetical protein